MLATEKYDFCGTPLAVLGGGVRPELENINPSKDGSHDMILSCRSDEGKGLHNRLSV